MKQNTNPKITALHGSQMLGTLLGNMKDLKSVLEGLVSKPLKKVAEESTTVRRSYRKVDKKRLEQVAFRSYHAAQPITVIREGKTFFFFATTKAEYEFEKENYVKSFKVRLQVAEWANDKIYIYATHIWVGFQCKYTPSLVRGTYLIDQVFQGEVDLDWQPTKAEDDPKFQDVQKALKEERGRGSSAYGWEGIDD